MKAKASPSNNYHYNKVLKTYARNNRNGLTKSAAAMWKYVLKGKMMLGYQFRRERPILNYIADFACLELLLVIEVDGITHDNPKQQARDAQRTKELEAVGFTVLRFSSWEVLRQINEVSNAIAEWIQEREMEMREE